MTFAVEFLRAVNDWRRGYGAAQKVVRAARLRAVAATVDARYRRADRLRQPAPVSTLGRPPAPDTSRPPP